MDTRVSFVGVSGRFLPLLQRMTSGTVQAESVGWVRATSLVPKRALG
jgi:hypothetical protein